MIDVVSLVASAFISIMFDFDLLIGLARGMVAVISRRIAAWSLTPTTSSFRFASDGRFVKIKSTQFFSLGCLLVLFVLGLGPLSCTVKRSFSGLGYLTF